MLNSQSTNLNWLYSNALVYNNTTVDAQQYCVSLAMLHFALIENLYVYCLVKVCVCSTDWIKLEPGAEGRRQVQVSSFYLVLTIIFHLQEEPL